MEEKTAKSAMIGDVEILLNYIPNGKQNAVSRFELRMKSGMTDRKMRKTIAEAISSGYPIINLDGGYYRPETIEEELAYFKRERARALSNLKKLSNMRLRLIQAGAKIN